MRKKEASKVGWYGGVGREEPFKITAGKVSRRSILRADQRLGMAGFQLEIAGSCIYTCVRLALCSEFGESHLRWDTVQEIDCCRVVPQASDEEEKEFENSKSASIQPRSRADDSVSYNYRRNGTAMIQHEYKWTQNDLPRTDCKVCVMRIAGVAHPESSYSQGLKVVSLRHFFY